MYNDKITQNKDILQNITKILNESVNNFIYESSIPYKEYEKIRSRFPEKPCFGCRRPDFDEDRERQREIVRPRGLGMSVRDPEGNERFLSPEEEDRIFKKMREQDERERKLPQLERFQLELERRRRHLLARDERDARERRRLEQINREYDTPRKDVREVPREKPRDSAFPLVPRNTTPQKVPYGQTTSSTETSRGGESNPLQIGIGINKPKVPFKDMINKSKGLVTDRRPFDPNRYIR